MKTILLIEDNQDIRENATELLELSGYRVIAAANGRIGLLEAKNQIPDLVLCDIMMPELNGYDVLRSLKADPLTENIPFVFVTASVERKDVESGLGMGAQGYLRKPFETEELFDIISDLLNKK